MLTTDNLPAKVYCVKHMTTAEYLCTPIHGYDHLMCFENRDHAIALRQGKRLLEFCDVVEIVLSTCPFEHFYLDGCALVLEKGKAQSC